MENEETINGESQPQESAGFTFVDESEVINSQQQNIDQVEEQVEDYVEGQPVGVEFDAQIQDNYDASTEEYQTESEYTQEEIESAVVDYLSERLGVEIDSIEDFLQEEEEFEYDERIEAIADFVFETGRSPQDWFIYQQLNPSEMDDMTAIQVQLASDYPNLSQEEVTTLINNKYKLDPDMHTEEDIRHSQLQLKIDASDARTRIEDLRERYSAPEYVESDEVDDPFDDDWYDEMEYETETLDGVQFELGNGQSFTFGLNDRYRNELMDKNSRLDEYFDPYVRGDGSWDFDKLNVHRAVVDNMEQIVQAVYKQGMADGQRGIVNQAANVQSRTPNQGGQPQVDSLSAQLREALGY